MRGDEVAKFLVERLNSLIEDPLVRHELGVFLDLRLTVADKLEKHPTLLVDRVVKGSAPSLSFIGVLNSLLQEKRVVAVFEEGRLVRFTLRTVTPPERWEIY